MHGVKRSRVPPVPDTAEVARKKQDKEQKRIEECRSLVEALLDKRDREEWNAEALELSGKVLGHNPEFQTAWAVRRRVLLNGMLPDLDSTARQTLLESDLQLTNASLKLNPKNYSVWEHRKWVLETMPDADWGKEMKMVEAYLEMDARNFHSWDYRRYLLISLAAIDPSTLASRTKPLPQPTIKSELDYTTRKISSNFSNFSAWHYRTKLLGKEWEGLEEGSVERQEKVDKEFDLVQQAIWSDPNDQSAWLYHRWLVGSGSVPIVRREISGINDLLEEEPDSRWCLDSLIYYKRLLVKLLDAEGEATRVEREALNQECLEMLRKLETVDPMRAARYKDLARTILPARR